MFTKKKIQLEITLQFGRFGNGTNTVVIDGLPVKVDIKKAGFPSMDEVSITILNLSRDMMESLTFLNFGLLKVNRNKIKVLAGTENDLSLAFVGEITSAVPNFNNAPDVSLEIKAITGFSSKVEAVPPYTQKGDIPVSQICETLAKDMGMTFVNKGVTKIAHNPVIRGSNTNKLINIAKAYDIGMTISNDIVTIYNVGDSSTRMMLSVDKDNGLLGYPSFTENGINCKIEYNPNLNLGDKFHIDSVLPKVTGDWHVVSLAHHICANMQGDWCTDIEASYWSFFDAKG